jgi:hypothetical protein
MSQQTTSPEREPNKAPEARRRLAYEAPRLTHLGNMREITLASTGTSTDGNGAGVFHG